MSELARGYMLVLIVVVAACGQSLAPGEAALRVAAWTSRGERIEKIWVVVSSLDARKRYMGNGRDVALSVPTGEYVLQVEAPGFQSKRQELKVYQPAVFRSVTLPVAWVHGRTVSGLTGTVLNYDGDIRNLRVRLIGLYGNELRESVLDAQGSFGFPADAGEYLLLVVADLEKGIAIVDSQPLRILGEENITIDLKGKHSTVLPPLAQQ
jgi:hypothetical protein